MGNIVYCANWSVIVAAAGGPVSNFQIFRQGRLLKIKSVSAMLLAIDTVANIYLTPERSQTIRVTWEIGNANAKICLPVQVTGGPAIDTTGQAFYMQLQVKTLQQMIFDGFDVSETLPMALYYHNYGPNQVILQPSIVVELQESINY